MCAETASYADGAYTQVLRGPVAQWLEQATHNRSVVSSILTGPTYNNPSDDSTDPEDKTSNQ